MKKRGKGDPMVGGDSEHESGAWGKGSYANMPQDVKMKEYPKMGYEGVDGIDDSEGRLESDAKASKRANRKNLDRGMY